MSLLKSGMSFYIGSIILAHNNCLINVCGVINNTIKKVRKEGLVTFLRSLIVKYLLTIPSL